MKKSLVMLLSGAAALLAVNSAQAAAPANRTSAVFEQAMLLDPLVDAMPSMNTSDEQRVQEPQARVQLAYYHSHHYYHRYPHFGVYVAPPYYAAAPGCYWRSHRIWNGWRWVYRRVRVCY
jgi:hypothetical protein